MFDVIHLNLFRFFQVRKRKFITKKFGGLYNSWDSQLLFLTQMLYEVVKLLLEQVYIEYFDIIVYSMHLIMNTWTDKKS